MGIRATHRRPGEPPGESSACHAAHIEANDQIAHKQPAVHNAVLCPAAQLIRLRIAVNSPALTVIENGAFGLQYMCNCSLNYLDLADSDAIVVRSQTQLPL